MMVIVYRHTVEVPQCHGDALADADIKSIQSNECDCTASSHWGPVGFDKKLHPLSIMVSVIIARNERHIIIISRNLHKTFPRAMFQLALIGAMKA